MRKYLRTKDLEDLTGVPRETWEQWRFRKQGPPVTRINRVCAYREDLFYDWLEKNTEVFSKEAEAT